MGGPGSGPPSVMGVTVHPESIELFVGRTEGCEALPLQFRSDPDRRSLSVERSLLPVTELSESAGKRTNPLAPLLVTAGHGADGLVMVNLESLGTLLVNGDPAGCEGLVRALALELATSYWSGSFDLNIVGFGAELERFERVVAVQDASMLLDRLHRRRLVGEALLRESRLWFVCGSSGGRLLGSVGSSCRPLWSDGCRCRRRGIDESGLRPGSGTGSRRLGDFRGSLTHAEPDRCSPTSSLEILGSVLFPQQVHHAELDEVTALVETAMNRQSVLLSEEPYVNLPVMMPRSAPAPEEEEVQITPPAISDGERSGRTVQRCEMHEVEVAVLGPIHIRGAAREFTRAWSRELVVYLAMHPNGASNEAWSTALWPDRLMAPSSLHSTASVARRALGQARNGTDHLPRSHGRLVLSDTVGTDWDLFLLHADTNDPAKWRTALELVRGRPFDGLRSSDWPILEGIGPAIEAAVVDLSGRLAGACLAAGNARGAEWAARRGLLVSPYDERLYRMLMRAADAAGNPAGVEAVMSELIRLVANEIEPFDSVHPSTMELYRSLTRRRNGSARLV